jgi:CheY-like chemotaxis protein
VGERAVPDVPVVLVVEDEEPLQDIVHDALKDGGFNLVIIASGEEAIALLKSAVARYSALVTDINVKGSANGWEVARQAREIEPSLAVVYMTGAAAGEWSAQGVPESILLQKPFAPAQLVTAVSQLLNKSTPT